MPSFIPPTEEAPKGRLALLVLLTPVAVGAVVLLSLAPVMVEEINNPNFAQNSELTVEPQFQSPYNFYWIAGIGTALTLWFAYMPRY